MLNEIEYDIKIDYEYLLEGLYELLRVSTNMSGDLECAVAIRKYTKSSSRKIKKAMSNFVRVEHIKQQLQVLIKETEKISFDYIKPPKEKPQSKDKEGKNNNVIIFPLEDDIDMYVNSEEKLDIHIYDKD